MKQHFDLVVVDSPPMGAVTDSLLIAERTDEVIYVCRFNRAYRKHIRLYIKQLRRAKMSCSASCSTGSRRGASSITRTTAITGATRNTTARSRKRRAVQDGSNVGPALVAEPVGAFALKRPSKGR